MRIPIPVAAAAMLTALGGAPRAHAQAGTDTTRVDSASTPKPAQPPAATASAPAASPSFDFSSVMFANFQYGGPKGDRSQNKFDVERAYLTFRGRAGERTTVRITADVFQQSSSGADAYYRGWTMRLKYGYVQYQYLGGTGDALKADARLGMLHTPIIEVEEQHWIRGLGPTALDATGFFSSADIGAVTNVTLPGKWGELYAGAFNGNGYTSRETDRFKDYGARLTLTPFARSASPLKGLSISPWYYKGASASRFLAGQGTLDPVREGRRKDRYGIFLGFRDPRLVLGSEFAWRDDEVETADTLVDAAPTVTDRRNSLLSTFAIVRPLALAGGPPTSRLLAVARYDKRPVRDADAYSRFYVVGLGWDLSSKTQLWLDWQSNQPRYAGAPASADTRQYFLHLIANF